MANISKVYLLNTPLENDMKNTLYFASASAQKSYMDNNVLKTYTDVSYQRDTSTFRCPAQIDSIRNCNYIMYQNTAYSNKWFYGFITKMTYINDGMTDVHFEIDPIQTFMFDITIKPSFVEREHTNNDAVGANLIPESLETGDYVNGNLPVQTMFDFTGSNKYMFVVACNRLIDVIKDRINPVIYTNVPEATINIGLPTQDDLVKFVNLFVDKGHPDYIEYIYVTPKDCWSGYYAYDNDGVSFGLYQNYQVYFTHDTTLTTDNKLAGNYSPRNAKLLTYPYRYVLASNGCGSVCAYHYECFTNSSGTSIESSPIFDLRGVGSVGCDIRLYPRYYNGSGTPWDNGITYGKLPTGSWTSDVFTNWLTQNAVNIGFGIVSDVVSTASSFAMAKSTGGENGGSKGSLSVGNIFNTIAQVYEHKIAPDQVHGETNIGNLAFYGHISVKFKHMSIRREMAEVIDSYFDVFGYATHKVKIPNTAHRQNWWYTKTIGCNIVGDVQDDYMNQIKEAYNNGITFWRNPSNFLDYSVSNGIV